MSKNKSGKMISRIMLSYAFTFMMIELVDSASLAVDGLLVSRCLGATPLASIALGDPSFHMISLLCGIFAIGIQSTCSSAMGSGDRKKTAEYFSSGLTVVTVIAILATVLGFLFLDPLCRLFGATKADAELYNGLYDYLRGWFVGIPGFIGFTILSPVVTLDGNKKCVTAAAALQSTINIVGDYVSLAVLKMGTLGAGLATGIGFDVALILLLLNFARKRSSFKLSFSLPKPRAVAEIFKIGMPRLTKYGCKLLSPLLINRTIIAVGGAPAMAAMAVKCSIGNFCLVAGAGIAESVNLLAQVFYSEKDKNALRQTARKAMLFDVIFCSIIGAAIYLGSELIAGLYLDRSVPEFGLTVTMLKCLALSLLLNGVNQLVLSYLQGTRKILPAHLQTASHRLVFLALSTFVLGKLFGVNGIFAAIPLSEVLVLAAYVILALASGKGKTRSDALLLLPKDFGYSDDDSLAFSLTTMDEVIGISEQVNRFCLDRGIDKRRSYYAALCIEELAGNVVGHGFKKDNKKHYCDVRVMIENDDVILRIRDDCRYFNLKERYEQMKNGDAAGNIGIRLVYGIAKDVNYVNLLNTNTLIIRV